MSSNRGDDKTAAAPAAAAITVDFLRGYPALREKSIQQLQAVVSKLNDEMVEDSFDLQNISRETLSGKIPGLVLDALKPESSQHQHPNNLLVNEGTQA